MWARYGCCALLILFVIFLIIVGVLAGIFKVPTVEFNGPTNHPAGLAPFEKSDTSLAFSVNFGLQIGVINNNVESITFESIRAIVKSNKCQINLVISHIFADSLFHRPITLPLQRLL